MTSEILKFIRHIQTTLDLEIYLVGGAVRDMLLGKPIKDFDFTTPLDPESVEEKILTAGLKAYTLGKRFGTVGLKIDGELIEITTFRQETYSPGNRKPTVEFVNSIHADLSRRDFSINAVAIKITNKNPGFEILDFFGGQQDLQYKLIKAVGNAENRFYEDPLRMLRAVRFAAALGFQIEPETFQAIATNHWQLLNISKERWVMEMDKILASERVDKGLKLLQKTGLLRILIPELSLQAEFSADGLNNQSRIWTQTIKNVEQIPTECLDLRWAALLNNLSEVFKDQRGYSLDKSYLNRFNADLALRICKHLKFSNQRTELILSTIKAFQLTTKPL